MLSDILSVSGAITAIGAAIAMLAKGTKWMFTHARKFLNFLDDWAGEPERDGVEAKPGVMARLANIEAEMRHNGGGSIKDAVHRIDDNLVELRQDFEKLRQDFDNHVMKYPEH